MRNAYPDLDRHDLSSLPDLRVVGIVGELKTFAQPEIAGRRVGGVFGGEFGESFDVRGVVEMNVLGYFGTAGGEAGGADWARRG